MRFGLFGGPVAFPGGRDQQVVYDDYLEYVVEAEALGFTSVFLTEHHFSGVGQATAPLLLLANLAARTETMRLGTGVTVLPWYSPIMVAEMAATLDVISKGRFDLGVGRGFRSTEFEGFGIAMDDAQDLYNEALEVITKAWSTGGRWSHDGKRWHYKDVIAEPFPVQKPHPPLWMGAGSRPGLEHAADAGFNLLLDQFGSFEATGERVEIYRTRLAELGKDADQRDIGVTRSLHLVDSPKARKEAIENRARTMSKIAALAKRKSGEQNRMAEAFASDMTKSTEEGAIIGDVEECAERLERLHEAGVENVLLVDIDDQPLESLRVFSNEVIPAFTARVGAAAGNS